MRRARALYHSVSLPAAVTAMRRRYAALLAVLCLAMPPLYAKAAAPAPSDQQVLHVLNRLAFGSTLDDFYRVKAIGIARYIAEQLHPETIPEPFDLTLRLDQLGTAKADAVELRRLYGPLRPVLGVKPTPEEQKAQQERARTVLAEAQQDRILRALYSRRQLQEVMVDFWFNHFNVFAGEELDRIWVGNYVAQAIRPYVLGHFRDLLLATAKHPAMLVYLDNTQNTVQKNGGPGLNENYAREVMELHTLGVDGGYAQADVIMLARILTGWRLNTPDGRQFPNSAAVFVGSRHDYAPKIFLGHKMQASGRAEGEEALALLAGSPATARHISFELAQYFVADQPPPALVERLAKRFLASDGDIRAVLQTLFQSPEFWNSAGDKYKTPLQYVISAVRAAGVPVYNPRPLIGAMAALGQPLYGCETPDGYKNTEAAWLSPDATLKRIGFALALARGTLPLVATPAGSPFVLVSQVRPRNPVDPAHIAAIFGASLGERTRAALNAAPPGLRAAMILGSPDFMMH
ncbi:MAG TPA: DUF1800 domain-containing protein [Stellaceae bacterium]|nr:DUF1800 domain-containing protein [Stellaceae bacterium]